MNTDILGGPIKFQADKTVYVLLSRDKTHVMANPDGTGSPFWSYDEKQIDVVVMSLKRDFKSNRYVKVTLATAIDLVGEKQSELQDLWEPVMKEILTTNSKNAKRNLYLKAKKAIGAHPVIFDETLKLELD